jgi:hypothetical protein
MRKETIRRKENPEHKEAKYIPSSRASAALSHLSPQTICSSHNLLEPGFLNPVNNENFIYSQSDIENKKSPSLLPYKPQKRKDHSESGQARQTPWNYKNNRKGKTKQPQKPRSHAHRDQ